MKEIFIIKDCFDSYEEIHKHFLTKATNVSVLSYEEATNLNSSKSTVLIHQKLEEKEGKSEILKFARDIGSIKIITINSNYDKGYSICKEMGGAYIKLSFKNFDEVIKEIIFSDNLN